MVILLKILSTFLLLWGGFLFSEELPLYRFQTEFSKNTIYQGEAVRCDFVLYTRLRSLEVEVARFPEFRGFWKKNTVLRQGPLNAPLQFYGTLWNRILIGSYELVPMVGEKHPKIEPMKLVVRSPSLSGFDTPKELTLKSQTKENLRVKPLPTPPEGIPFHGAVGEFRLRAPNNRIRYVAGEPFSAQLVLDGRGNFQDINTVHSPWPETFKILSQESRVSGVFPFQSKIFDWTLSSQFSEASTIQGVSFHFFNPETARFEKTTTRELYFEAAPPVEVDPPQSGVAFGPLRPRLDRQVSWEKTGWFLLLNGVLGFVLFVWVFKRLHLSFSKPRPTPKPISKVSAETAKEALARKDYQLFLTEAQALAANALKQKAGITQKGLPNAALLKLSARSIDPILVAHAKNIFKSHESICFGPKPATLENPEEVLQSLEALLAA